MILRNKGVGPWPLECFDHIVQSIEKLYYIIIKLWNGLQNCIEKYRIQNQIACFLEAEVPFGARLINIEVVLLISDHHPFLGVLNLRLSGTLVTLLAIYQYNLTSCLLHLVIWTRESNSLWLSLKVGIK